MSHRITDWDPEDVVAWESGNKNIARRNLISSVAAEHIVFSVWSIWSVTVLFRARSPATRCRRQRDRSASKNR